MTEHTIGGKDDERTVSTVSTGLFSKFSGWSLPSIGADQSSTTTAPKSSSPPPQDVPTDTIVVSHAQRPGQPPPPPEEDLHRAVHRIHLSALEHNYAFVEAAANRQRCSVIVVVKADGYGHGAIASALHLADHCGADAFAVATLEEGIALRKAFENNPPGRWNKNLAALFHTQQPDTLATPVVGGTTIGSGGSRPSSPTAEATARVMRATRIRILVLGPPVGFPRCFDDYYHHGIEVMVSGPEVATALMEWVADEKERKRTAVERAATEAKTKALINPHVRRDSEIYGRQPSNGTETQSVPVTPPNEPRAPKLIHPSSTLGNVSGQDLANEVRAILMNQNKAATEAAQQGLPVPKAALKSAANSTVGSENSSVSSGNGDRSMPVTVPLPRPPQRPGAQVFSGIEAAAKNSRQRAMRANGVFAEDCAKPIPTAAAAPLPPVRKTLRWHALVDSGMGRLGFRTEVVKQGEDRRDTVAILKELVDAEVHGNAPIEFLGMCTHMADANATSDYTNSQIAKFINLLKRVRAAEIFVPTVSTDNSAALLTTNLTHFDPKEILSQAHASTRGYVRTGGAIYGQRPAFKQLRAVSTLLASVRHVAILKKGETVGYDRAYTAPYDVRIATLTIGFADGYPRELGNGVGKVAIRGAVFPVAGNVCMDMMMVELGPAEDKTGVGASVAVRDTAVLWGPLDEDEDEGLVRLQDIAATLKTTQSALTCGLDKIRVRRQFI